MAKVYYDNDIDMEVLREKTIAVIGYGNQGSAQAQNLRDSGLNVILGLREGISKERAINDGFEVFSIDEASRKANIIYILIPDEAHSEVYYESIHNELSEGKTLCFSHGFNIHYGRVRPPEFVDVIMVAPKGPGALVRKQYVEGKGVPSLVAVEQDYTGNALQKALAIAKGIGSARVGVIETTFKEETETDLFGEQVVLCGGVSELIKRGFEVLIEAGYQPEIAYFEVCNELKLIVDLIYTQGIEGMWKNVSNTAEYGGRTRGKRIIDENTKKRMWKILKEIQDGTFAQEWIIEGALSQPRLFAMRRAEKEHPIETIGKKIRKLANI